MDDSDSRAELILKRFRSHALAGQFEVVRCVCADEARKSFLSPCDFAVLDLLLPKKQLGTPSAVVGVKLLNDVCDPGSRYIRPRMIVGLTADCDGLASYREQYASQASIVLDAPVNNIDWLDALIAQAESLAAADRKVQQTHLDRVLVTIHGIRTYGKWQERLSESLRGYSRTFKSIEVKYEFVDLLSFFFPVTRRKSIEKNVNRLLSEMVRHSDSDIYVVAHSFGTLIVSEALRIWQQEGRKKMVCVILAGSPMDREADIEHIISASVRTVNECGTFDLALIFARLFGLGLGDAGRGGFLRANSDQFVNRYHRGGHSLYFKKVGKGAYFFEKYWFRLLTLDHAPKRVDMRRGYPLQDLGHLMLKGLTKLKPGWYVVGLAGALWFGVTQLS